METWAWLTIKAPGSEFNDLFLMRVCYQLPVFALILSSYQWCTYSYVILSIGGVEVVLPNSQERKTSDVYCHYRKTSRAHHTHTLRYHVCLVGVGALYYWKIVKLSEKKLQAYLYLVQFAMMSIYGVFWVGVIMIGRKIVIDDILRCYTLKWLHQ